MSTQFSKISIPIFVMGFLQVFKIFSYVFLSHNFATASSSTATVMDIQWLNFSGSDPLAVCNDGTTPAYYIKTFTDPVFSDYWLIHLQGGGQCYSEETCNDRTIFLKSSKYYGNTMSKDGIFDSELASSSLAHVNKVYLAYCSSDGWIGDAAASESTWGYHFRGQRIIRSALHHLVKEGKLTLNSKILFSGGSAGARGEVSLFTI